MAEPEEIITILGKAFSEEQTLFGKKALVTAGPTYEAIDPIRFIGNHSSGKMGFAIAEELAKRGAEVTLICGPNTLQVVHKNITRIDVTNAEELYQASVKAFKMADISILSAAVSDFKSSEIAKQKIKKNNAPNIIKLVSTIDTLAELGKIKKENQLLVGFALETENELANATTKLKNKNLDLIILNSLNDVGAGFKTTTNKITVIDKYNKIIKFELKSKPDVARDLVEIIQNFKNK